MSEFRFDGSVFGKYCKIEMKRYGAPNEYYIHKCITSLRSNCWVDVPIQEPPKETMHDSVEDVLNVICCGIDETKVLRVRERDVELIDADGLRCRDCEHSGPYFEGYLWCDELDAVFEPNEFCSRGVRKGKG